MHLDLDEILFLLIFIIYNIFMINIVEGLITKLFFLYWIISVLCFAGYIILKRDNTKET